MGGSVVDSPREWDEKVTVVTCSKLNLHGEVLLPLFVWRETGPLLLRALTRHELTPKALPLLVRHKLTALPRGCSPSEAQ
jgi:hypothetical protein